MREQDLLMVMKHGAETTMDGKQANIEQEGGLMSAEEAPPGPSQADESARIEVVEEDAEYALHLSPNEEDILSDPEKAGDNYSYDYSSDEMPDEVKSSFSSRDVQYSGICSITVNGRVVCVPLGSYTGVTSAGRKGAQVEGAGSSKQQRPFSDKTRKLIKKKPGMDIEGM